MPRLPARPRPAPFGGHTPGPGRRRGGDREFILLVMAIAAFAAALIFERTPRMRATEAPTPPSAVFAQVTPAPGVVYGFKNCGEARAAGIFNIPASHPSYRSWMDRDGDGLACEPYR